MSVHDEEFLKLFPRRQREGPPGGTLDKIASQVS